MKETDNVKKNKLSKIELMICVMIYQLPFIIRSSFGSIYLVSVIAMLFILYPERKKAEAPTSIKPFDIVWLLVGFTGWLIIFIMSLTDNLGNGLTVNGVILIPSYLTLIDFVLPIIWIISCKSAREYLHLSKKNIKFALLMIIPFVFTTIESIMMFRSNPMYDKKTIVQMIFQLIVTAAIAEELFFRGFLYNLIKNVSNMYIGMVVSSILFVLLHTNILVPLFHEFNLVYLLNAIVLIFLGIVNCLLLEYSRSIYIPIIFHILFNGTLNFICYFFIV